MGKSKKKSDCHALEVCKEYSGYIPYFESLRDHRNEVAFMLNDLKRKGLLRDTFSTDDMKLWGDPLYMMNHWIQWKQIYTMHQPLVGDLIDTIETPIPIDAIHIPFPCMFIDMEEAACGIAFADTPDDIARLLGFFVLMREEEDMSFTCGVNILMRGTDGKYEIFGDMFDIRPNERDLTLDAVILFATRGDISKASYLKWAFLMAAYIGSTNPDIVENPRQKAIYRPTRDPLRYASVRKWDVGSRYMKERSAYSQKNASSHEGTHASPRPHLRRAHWHTFLTGHGRTEKCIKWIPPVAVNFAKGDKSENLPAVIRTKD